MTPAWSNLQSGGLHLPDDSLQDCCNNARPSAGPHNHPQLAICVHEHHRGHAGQWLLPWTDEVGPGWLQVVDVSLLCCGEVVHLIVQKHTCASASLAGSARQSPSQ